MSNMNHIGYRFRTSKGMIDHNLFDVPNDAAAYQYALHLKDSWKVKNVVVHKLYEAVEEVK